MQVSDIERLYDYSCWANQKLFAVLAQLTPDQFTQSVAGSYGSIRNTLVHVVSAEWGWIDRCGGPPRGPRLNPDDYPTLDSLIELWRRVEAYMRAFLSTLSDTDLDRKVDFAIVPGSQHTASIGHLMQHAIVHGVHHRGQVALLVRMLGHTPGNFDLFLYGD